MGGRAANLSHAGLDSPPGQGSHQGQWATDWAAAGNVTFPVLAATEGDATCAAQGGFGYRIDLVRIDNREEWYAHLPFCPFTGTKHFEQGDFLSASGDSGGDYDIHLHYEVPSGQHWLSQFWYFDDVDIHRTPSHHHHPAIADNAGPGLNPWDGDVWNQIYWTYKVWEAIACPNQGWTCIGSSKDLLGDGFAALPYTLAGDPGWLQWFRSLSPTTTHAFSRPNACNKAYPISANWFGVWFFNSTTLGHARSGVHWDDFHGFPTGPGWYQFFRYGFLYSPTPYGTPQIYGALMGCT